MRIESAVGGLRNLILELYLSQPHVVGHLLFAVLAAYDCSKDFSGAEKQMVGPTVSLLDGAHESKLQM